MKTLFSFLVAILIPVSLYASGWPVVDAGALAFQSAKARWEEIQWGKQLIKIAPNGLLLTLHNSFPY